MRGADAYLDVCLADRGVKALTLEARAGGDAHDAMSGAYDRLSRTAIPQLQGDGLAGARRRRTAAGRDDVRDRGP